MLLPGGTLFPVGTLLPGGMLLPQMYTPSPDIYAFSFPTLFPQQIHFRFFSLYYTRTDTISSFLGFKILY